jgi:hypothetical protein
MTLEIGKNVKKRIQNRIKTKEHIFYYILKNRLCHLRKEQAETL